MVKQTEEERRREEARRNRYAAAGIGVGLGIGSAALAAALLYTRGAKKKDSQPPRTSTAPKTPIQEGNRWTD